ncbi:MAG: hypothetical protein DMG21_18495 [Acidobacteria bacterium]|nr:MAG: hypothetical protein DMG21_18495 [Acidobacteriota bacterium]
MEENENAVIKARIDKIRQMTGPGQGATEIYEAVCLAQSVLDDTIGGTHPIMAALQDALNSADWMRSRAASRSVVTLYDEGALRNPRLAIAREIEGDLLDIAQRQAQAAETNRDPAQKQLQLAIAAFLAGASLEDALRRLCDARGIAYEIQRTSISKFQSVLFQPSKQIEVISTSENKRITAWADTRNKADHGRFGEITHTEVVTMVLAVRAFIERHLP